MWTVSVSTLGNGIGAGTRFSGLRTFFQVVYQDPVLARYQLIVEAWDIGEGGYRGQFPAAFCRVERTFPRRYARVWVWESGNLGAFAERLAGSSDIFNHSGRHPFRQHQFHHRTRWFYAARFQLQTKKHNHANGEDNRDGT